MYHYIQFQEVEPHFVVDISGFMDRKMQAVSAYASQFYDAIPETTNYNFNKIVLGKRSLQGGKLRSAVSGEFCEGFTAEKPIVIDSFFNIS